MDMELQSRLQALSPQINEICSVSGNAGLSIGVLHHGRVIHRANHGYRDVEARFEPDSDTVYHLASLSKFVTSAAVAVLVEEGKMQWESRIADLLPGFHQKNEEVEEKANLIDLLGHRLALEMKVPYWQQMYNQLLLPASEGVNILGALESVGKFRKDLKYNNWTYGVVGDIIERYSGQSLDDFVKTRLLDPLDLERTSMGTPASENYTKSYMCLNDGTPYEIPPPSLTSGSIIAASSALKSSINDMLAIYDSFMKANAHQREKNTTSTPSSPFAQTKTLLAPHITKNKTSYGLGWFLTDLPGEIGWIGLNEARVKKMPIIGRGTSPTSIAYHNGNTPGALSSVHLIPETHTAIVVFANSIPFSDIPDWVGGLLLETVLGTPDANDFVALAKEARATAIVKPAETATLMEKEREKDTPVKPLVDYTGRYYNNIGNFYLDVTVQGDGLRLCVQGFENTCYDLYHYQHDTFAWACDREAEVRKAMFPTWYDEFHKIHFAAGDDNGIDRTIWKHGRDVPAPGETFMKSLDGQPFCWQPSQLNSGFARI